MTIILLVVISVIIVVGIFLVKRYRQKEGNGIEIVAFRNTEGRIWGYTVSGHYGQRGNSIICAGVSVLAQTTLKGIGEHLMRLNGISEENEESLSAYLKYKIAPGDLQVRLVGSPDEITDVLLETMLIGMYDIHDNLVRENDPDGVHIYEIQQDQEV